MFEGGSENLRRLKHLENPLVGRIFEGRDPRVMAQAKEILRKFTIYKLKMKKDCYGDRSRVEKRGVNERYLELFLEEMKEGRIKERISKEDKARIFEERGE